MANVNEPIYIRLQRELMLMLNDRDYSPGSKIPSERELSQQFGASRMTMRKALDQLVSKGALERRGTSGTYLPEHIFSRTVGREVAFGVSEVAHEHGREAGSKLLFFEKQFADEEAASKLQVEIGEPIICISRQRTIDGVAVCLELSKIPTALIPGLSASDVMENASLYKLFSERYGLDLRVGESRVTIGLLSGDEGVLLELPEKSAVLELQCMILLKDGKPFEYLRSLNHPEHVSFLISGSENSGKNSSAGDGLKFSFSTSN